MEFYFIINLEWDKHEPYTHKCLLNYINKIEVDQYRYDGYDIKINYTTRQITCQCNWEIVYIPAYINDN